MSGKALTNTSQNPVQDSAAGASTPRPQAASVSEQSPTKGYVTPTPATPRHSRRSHAATPSQFNLTPIDPALLPPPLGFLENPMSLPSAAAGGLSFSLDEGSGTGAPSAVDTPWEDNTLAPMIWDELT